MAEMLALQRSAACDLPHKSLRAGVTDRWGNEQVSFTIGLRLRGVSAKQVPFHEGGTNPAETPGQPVETEACRLSTDANGVLWGVCVRGAIQRKF
jgi:hypothetical protein